MNTLCTSIICDYHTTGFAVWLGVLNCTLRSESLTTFNHTFRVYSVIKIFNVTTLSIKLDKLQIDPFCGVVKL